MSTALLFPGQGAQVVGMGAGLVQRSSIAKELFAEAADLLGFDLLRLCTNGPQEELNRTEYSQPALFVHSYAALKQLELDRPNLWNEVRCVAGLSLGEYTAVAATGGMTFADGLRLVQVRGRAMQAAADLVPSGMSSVLGLDLEKLTEVCRSVSQDDSFVMPANLLCPGNIAVSGHITALKQVEPLCEAAGAMRSVRLQVAGAFHTPLMQSAVKKLNSALASVPFSETRVPVVSNVDASPHTKPKDFPELLPKQVVSPVLWEASLKWMLAQGVTSCIEVGVGRVLAGTLKRIDRKLPCENYGD